MNSLLFFAGIAAGMVISAGIGLVMAAGIRSRRVGNHRRTYGADLWEIWQ